MLPSHTSASELLNTVINQNDKDDNNCDLESDDDEEDNSNKEKPTSSKITIQSKYDSLTARRPLALNLKPIITTNVSGSDYTSEKVTPTTHTRTRNNTQKQIDIEFNDIIYSARRGLCWNRGEFSIQIKYYHNFTTKWQLLHPLS